MLSAAWRSFDARPTLSREEARAVYDRFAEVGHIGGEDVSSGYGGPAVQAILRIAGFADCRRVLEFGCGQGKLAQLVLDAEPKIEWHALDQSPRMIERARARLSPYGSRCTVSLLASGAPRDAVVAPRSVDRVVSTYCLDLMSEEDMYGVLDLAERSLHPERGLLILSGITWGYRDSFRTFFMTLVWEVLYRVSRRTVGGCRPQQLEPYLRERGWNIVSSVRTLPDSFPWMVSEVIGARPPSRSKEILEEVLGS